MKVEVIARKIVDLYRTMGVPGSSEEEHIREESIAKWIEEEVETLKADLETVTNQHADQVIETINAEAMVLYLRGMLEGIRDHVSTGEYARRLASRALKSEPDDQKKEEPK